MIKKRLFLLVMVFALVVSSFGVQANNNGNNGNDDNRGKDDFKDLSKDHWAYDEIMLMYQYGIIGGNGDGTFSPESEVTRAQFAKMMVLTMGMDLYNPSTPTFLDVAKGDWEYKYVETAKKFLTGWKTAQGFMYKPKSDAVREDMAVAIVQALGLNPDNTDLAILNQFSDQGSISTNLRKYVATAVKEKIMVGNDKGQFQPNGSLTRAEAATVLARLILEEKVTFDEEKVPMDDETAEVDRIPYVTASVLGAEVVIDWSKVASNGFSYYKVVLSQSDSTPSYPDNGYMTAISDLNTTSYTVKAGMSYNSGDFGGTLEAGKTYYAAITAVYSDGKQTSNVIQITIPIADTTVYVQPTLSSVVGDNVIALNWTQATAANFTYYKVVVSKNDDSPSYPDNGYAVYYNNISTLTHSLKAGDSYNGGDFGGTIKAGESYYVAITAVNGDSKKTSNVLRVTIPGTAIDSSTQVKTPVLSYSIKDGGAKLTWTKTSDSDFSYYKVVVSKYDSTPAYPSNGYATYISDANVINYTLYAGSGYNGGDFGEKLKSGATYYVAITACYNNGDKFTSNVKTIKIP